MTRYLSVLLLALLSLTAPSWASVIYVSGDQTGAWAADTVIVTAEVRVPPGQSLTILPGVEVLFSVYCKLIVDNGATLLAVGTLADSIRFDILPPNEHWHGLRFLSASNSSRLEYCHLTHGYATGGGEDSKGGAIYCSGSSPTISHNTIRGNSAEFGHGSAYGGGIYCLNSSPSIIGNAISGNSASGGSGGGYGGGISCADNSNPIICDNIISENCAIGGGAGLGGGISCLNNSNPTIIGNTISENSFGGDGGSGGGIYCGESNPIIISNTISENQGGSITFGMSGGGISCSGGSSTIISNTITGNSILGDPGYGGGIFCYSTNPTIIGNNISENSALGSFSSGGGGIYCNNASPGISGNTISDNTAGNGGGGISCQDGSNAVIQNCTISGNSATNGGGIGCNNSSPIISGNTIIGNSATCGSGISCDNNSNPTISSNTISENSAFQGGGIFCYYSSPIINGNTISENIVVQHGGGIYCWGSSNPILVNCILWENSPEQIWVQIGSPRVNYSDIQGGYTGTGNIDAYPTFVDTAQSDYRLQWGSPCIDTGDPNPIYNDPDLTRADMGAWYYDQSRPVRILLTPYNAPIEIPTFGGSFQYAIQVTNIGSTTLPTLGWCNVTLPSGAIYGPVLGPLTISLGSGLTLSRLRTQVVPASAPAGMYHYNAYAVAAGDTSEDSFTFVKSWADGWDLGAGGWANTGEEFEVGARHAVPVSGSGPEGGLRSATPTTAISPNPFNPSTAISYKLQAASHVCLHVYDSTGRLVATLVDGWREAGVHQVVFDGSGLAAGVYLYRFEAGGQTASGKVVLLK